MTNPNLITPCPVCGVEIDCPHTPVRCRHSWSGQSHAYSVGDRRECEHCGRIERATLEWETVKA